MTHSFGTEQIRNVVVLGHTGSGKSTLVDATCFALGASARKGSVEDGSALTITTPEEADAGMSMQLVVAHARLDDVKINLIDTPGYMDFVGESIAAVRVADGAVVAVGATAGVEVGTEMVWDLCEAKGLPRMIHISMMDKPRADFRKAFDQVKEELTGDALALEIPIGAGADFRGVVDLISGKAHLFSEGTQTGEYVEAEVPEEMADEVEEWQTELMESIVTTDEELLDRYLEGEELAEEEVVSALGKAVGSGDAVPVLCGAAEVSYGVRELAKRVVTLLPHPGKAAEVAVDHAGNSVRRSAGDEPASLLVFKTTAEPHVGELSLFRVFSGVISNGLDLRNLKRGSQERLNHIAVPLAKERLEVDRLHAGDIGVVAKLKSTRTNDTLSAPDSPVTLGRIDFPSPDISIAVKGKSRADEDRMSAALSRLNDEDPTFVAEFNPELRQTIARGMGEIHINVAFARMKRKYGVEVETEQPRIAYRETITRVAEGQGRFKKQSGGRGQFGDCWVRLRPAARGEGYTFVNSIKGGVIPTKYVPSVDRGIQEAAAKGILAGYPMVDFEAECYFGSYHSVDSSDIAFKVAGSYGFKNVAEKARPVLLEPIVELRVTTPDEYVGDVMGDLNSRSAKVQGMEPKNQRTVIVAQVAQAELYKYASTLRSITQGRGFHKRKVLGYDVVPHARAQKIVQAAHASQDD